MRFSRFFIDRPVFAVVLSLDRSRRRIDRDHGAAGERVSRSHSADDRRSRGLSGRQSDRARADGRHAARGRDQRRRAHALHVVVGDGRRRAQSHRHVRDRHERRPRAGPGAESRQPGARATCPKKCARSASRRRSARPTSRWSCTSCRPTGATIPCTSATTRCSTCATSSRDCRARDRWSSSAPATTRCASGSIPNKVAARGLSASDVVQAIREQNLQVAAGVVGGQPMPDPVAYQLTVTAKGRLTDEIRVRQHHREDGRERRSHATARRRAAASSAPATSACARCSTTSRPSRSSSFRRRARTRSRCPARSRDDGRAQDALPAGRRMVGGLRPDGLRARFDPRSASARCSRRR